MTEQVARMTELQSSAGTNMVLAGVVILAVLSVLGLMVGYLRLRLRDEVKDREQERAERVKLFEHVLEGNGDRSKPGLRQVGERLEEVAEQQRELGDYVVKALSAGDDRMGGIEASLAELRATVSSQPCMAAESGGCTSGVAGAR